MTKILPSVLYPNLMDYVCGECVLQAMGMGKMRWDTSLSPIGTEHLVKPNAADVRHSGRTASGKPSVITSKAANGYHFKTGQREAPGTSMFYPAVCYSGKSIKG